MEMEMWWSINVPVVLIADRRVPHAARALYMTLVSQYDTEAQECSISNEALMRLSRFGNVVTLRKHLELLQQAGWVTIEKRRGRAPWRYRLRTEPSRNTVRIPGALTTIVPVSPTARWLYAYVTTQGRNPFLTRQQDLADNAGFGSRVTVRKLIEELRHTGWLSTGERGANGRPYIPLDPHLAARQRELRRVKTRLRHEPFRGEGLAKELLTALVADDRFHDNARPRILTNPRTGERMEFDRWYAEAQVAIEFHGAQHFHATERFSEEDVREQQARDLMKLALADEHGITVVPIEPKHLNVDTLRTMLTGVLPLRTLRAEDPVLRYLQRRIKLYRQWADTGRRTDHNLKAAATAAD